MNVVAGLGTRIVKGKQADKSLILDKVGALRAQADDRHQNDLAALRQVPETQRRPVNWLSIVGEIDDELTTRRRAQV